MVDFRLLIDLHKDAERQGPGGVAQTQLALRLTDLSARSRLKVADIGCGTGASTRVLARELDAHVTAVDFIPEFLDILQEKAEEDGTAQKIETVAASMEELPFADASLDAIWAEGAIYNIGFLRGISEWKRFLKPNGVLAVSELTWLTCDRPEELQRHWENEYPEVASASHKLGQLEESGYKPIGYFSLPQECWLENYYRPMQNRFDGFLERHGKSAAALEVVKAEQSEIDLYERYSDHVSYGFYVAKRLP
jgi:ubiquinone/menaquinone biosynthesis C-methylase UbiE